MKKRYKYAIIFLFLHLLARGIPDFIFTNIKLSTVNQEGIGAAFYLLAYPYEYILLFLANVINFQPKWLSTAYFFFNYLIGSCIYFLIGMLIGYLLELKKIKKN